MKLALAMIVKGDDNEADCLNRCLGTVAKHVDGIFITRTHKQGETPNERVKEVAELWSATVSDFEWVNDFSKARNFNFSQVPQEYDFILWLDADDILRAKKPLKDIIAKNDQMDAFSMNYLYDFDDYKRPTVVHMKTQIVRNDGCVSWKGHLHEDFVENRSIRVMFLKDVERLHLTDKDKIEHARQRNIEVALKQLEDTPEDPRSYWNVGNAYLSLRDYDSAVEHFEHFLDVSESDEEKYLVYLRLSGIELHRDNLSTAKEWAQLAIGLRPNYPDAYFHMAHVLHAQHKYAESADSVMNGLRKKPPTFSIIVYNPRDYDYNPMMLLAKLYVLLSRPDLALIMLEACHKIYPQDDSLKALVKEMKKESKVFDQAIKELAELEKMTSPEEQKKKIDALKPEIRSHPSISLFHNRRFIKETSSGKDLVIYCGRTAHEWNPALFEKKGFGGSEEAIIHLSKGLAEAGWNVSVYNSMGSMPKKFGKVMWYPFWWWNFRDKQDVTILWRHPKIVDYGINSTKIYVDLHDALQAGEFTPKRLKLIDKVFVKTQFHRSLFPNIPDNKIAIIPNGQDPALFEQDVERDPYLLVNTSSPDRSLGTLVRLFPKVKARVPEAKCVWAYGWDIFDIVHGSSDRAMQWKKDIQEGMRNAGIEELGRLTQKDTAGLYLKGRILAYPTEFAEIDCITAKKAQACGCIPVTTDFGALNESVQFGVKVHSDKTKDDWAKPYQLDFGLDNERAEKEWVDAVVEILTSPMLATPTMREWAKLFAWDKIIALWLQEL